MQDNTVIVFAGDSVTDADKANTYDRAGNGYVRLVRNYLRAFRPQEWYKVVNAGISGNTTRDLLARWDKDVAGENPDVIFCLIGINDVWRHFDGLELPVNAVGEEEFGRNMRAICEKMKGKRAFVLSPYYLERNRTDEMRAMTERGIKIPEDVSMLGFDDLSFASISNPPLTTMRVPNGEMGELAVKTIVDRMRSPRDYTSVVHLSTTFVERQSVLRLA